MQVLNVICSQKQLIYYWFGEISVTTTFKGSFTKINDQKWEMERVSFRICLPSGGNIMPIIFWVEGQVSIEKTIRKWSHIFIENFLFSTRNMHFNLILLSRVSSLKWCLNLLPFELFSIRCVISKVDCKWKGCAEVQMQIVVNKMIHLLFICYICLFAKSVNFSILRFWFLFFVLSFDW